MRAYVIDPDRSPAYVRMAEVPEPQPGPQEVLVEVRHISVNRAEPLLARGIPYGAGRGTDPAGTVHGFDFSGVVLETTEGGPAVGERVVAWGHGGWAQRATAHMEDLAVVPEGADLAEAAALPVAGLTALRTVRAGGAVLGRRVLVTGASGGVGRYAVQLAALAGAFVIASVGSAERGEGLRELGADQVVVGLDGVTEPVDLVLDNVGGPQLLAAYNLLAPGGSLLLIGAASGETTVLPPNGLFAFGKSRTVSAVGGDFSRFSGNGDPLGPDLRFLIRLLAQGRLKAEVGWRGSWERLDDAYEELFSRKVAGKAVLDVA
ncbi:zinc-binding dehydrogenase [Streptomyces fuscichromogenes]|uniref:Oxidoreductase n=1 Tax=Streptomyces fuscichromogenes TaxID=1324013 RepID=A0A917XHI6_9ACTN|nr:zinc-binding dehydrogenase [Streptomyces fuscichromogenes]GGN22991.1 oxidoreductase [Streptomyces fuscichromogenes]